jgi:von Willebrand factor type C domain
MDKWIDKFVAEIFIKFEFINCFFPVSKFLKRYFDGFCFAVKTNSRSLSFIAGCYLNGQHVLEGREVTLSEDPCVKCQCKGKRLTCQKKACPVLQCPLSKQAKAPGECCPRCIARRELIQIPGNCIFGLQMHMHGKSFLVDACTRCTCMNGTSICQRNTCPVLECPQEYQEITPGDCCPRCPLVDEVKSICSYDGRTYQVSISPLTHSRLPVF